MLFRVVAGGWGGIRTHGRLHVAGFQDRCLKPLGHPSSIGRGRLSRVGTGCARRADEPSWPRWGLITLASDVGRRAYCRRSVHGCGLRLRPPRSGHRLHPFPLHRSSSATVGRRICRGVPILRVQLGHVQNAARRAREAAGCARIDDPDLRPGPSINNQVNRARAHRASRAKQRRRGRLARALFEAPRHAFSDSPRPRQLRRPLHRACGGSRRDTGSTPQS